MQKLIIGLSFLGAALFSFGSSASAMECEGFIVPDEIALGIVNQQAAGARHEISKRKTLVINSVDSLSGSLCSFSARVDVTLKRKIRQDANGHVTLKGALRIADGRICIANASVSGVDLSNTLNIGEAVYGWVANKALPSTLCF
jgi:hypothetical protein